MEYPKHVLATLAVLTTAATYAQKPTEVPKPSEEPIDLSDPADIILYIVLPLCAIMLFFVWRSYRKKRRK